MTTGELTVKLAALKQASSSSVVREMYGARIRNWAGVSPSDIDALLLLVGDAVRRKEAAASDLARLRALRAELD